MARVPLPRGLLALPSPTDRTVHRLRRKVRLLAVRALLTSPLAGLTPPRTRAMAAVRRFVTQALAQDPDRVLLAIGSHDVLPSLLSLHSGALPVATCLRAVPALLARLTDLGPDAPLLWEGPIGALAESDRGPARRFDPPVRTILFARAQIEVERADGGHVALSEISGAQRSWPVSPGLELCIEDTNPLALIEAHPDKRGNACDLGGRPVAEWVDSLRRALELVAHLPAWSGELASGDARLVPVGFEPERHLSASYREAPGLLYLTLHPDPLTLAEAIVHETQHSKLNLLSWLDPVLLNGRTTWTSSPVRPDLRPLMGVFLAAHAFVPVAALHSALEEAGHPVVSTDRFAQRRSDVRDGNTRALAILDDLAAPTKVGRRVLEDLRKLHAVTADPARRAPMDPDALPPG